jgi:hypothetical protein
VSASSVGRPRSARCREIRESRDLAEKSLSRAIPSRVTAPTIPGSVGTVGRQNMRNLQIGKKPRSFQYEGRERIRLTGHESQPFLRKSTDTKVIKIILHSYGIFHA